MKVLPLHIAVERVFKRGKKSNLQVLLLDKYFLNRWSRPDKNQHTIPGPESLPIASHPQS